MRVGRASSQMPVCVLISKLCYDRNNSACGCVIPRHIHAYIYIMDKTVEIVLSAVTAVVLVGVIVWTTRLKTRGVTRLIINSLAGGALIAGLSAFNVIVLPFNAFNALIVGALGLPGVGVVIAAALLL